MLGDSMQILILFSNNKDNLVILDLHKLHADFPSWCSTKRKL